MCSPASDKSSCSAKSTQMEIHINRTHQYPVLTPEERSVFEYHIEQRDLIAHNPLYNAIVGVIHTKNLQ